MQTRNKLILIISLDIIAIIGIIIFLIIPTAKNMKAINNQITDFKKNSEKGFNNTQSFKNIITKLKTIESSVDEFLNIYVAQDGELNLITELEGIASKNNLEQKINLSTSKEGESSLNLNLTGEYKDILKYLYDLRRLNYYINIESVSIKKGKPKQQIITPAIPEESASIKLISTVETNVTAKFYILPQYKD